MLKTNHPFVNFGFICNEDASKMTPNESGKFCSTCQKNVVRFTDMSSSQAYDYLKKNKNVCGSMSAQKLQQLNTYAGLKQSRSFSLKALLSGISLSMSSMVLGQETPKILFENENIRVIELADGINPDSLIDNKIKAIITDADGNPIPFLTVVLPEANQGMRTNFEGEFNFLYDAEIPGNIHLRFNNERATIDSSMVAQDYANKLIQIIAKNHLAENDIQIEGIMYIEPTNMVKRLDTKVRALFRYDDNKR